MRAFGSVTTPEGRFDVTLEVSGVDPSIRSVDDVRARYEAAPALLEACEAAIPLLIRLGDFIGNGEDPLRDKMERCGVIFGMREAIRSARNQ